MKKANKNDLIFVDGDFNNSYESRVRNAKGKRRYSRYCKCDYPHADNDKECCRKCGKLLKV